MTMGARLLWGLAFACALFYVLFRQASLDARIEALSESVARLEQSMPSTLPAEERRERVIAVGSAAEGEVQGAVPADAPEKVQRLEQEVAELRDAMRKAPVSEEKILDVVETKREAVFARQLEFHRQRWVEARADGLDKFSETANLSPRQRERLDDLLNDEVERVMEILLDPAVRDDPERLIEAWDETLNTTDLEVRSILVPFQRAKWEEARAFERQVFFPFLN